MAGSKSEASTAADEIQPIYRGYGEQRVCAVRGLEQFEEGGYSKRSDRSLEAADIRGWRMVGD
jgi:hypothetical protein